MQPAIILNTELRVLLTIAQNDESVPMVLYDTTTDVIILTLITTLQHSF